MMTKIIPTMLLLISLVGCSSTSHTNHDTYSILPKPAGEPANTKVATKNTEPTTGSQGMSKIQITAIVLGVVALAIVLWGKSTSEDFIDEVIGD